MMDDDIPTASKKWRRDWDKAMADLAPVLLEKNAIFPKEGWMTTNRQQIGPSVFTTHTFSPEIVAWCKEHYIKIEPKGEMILGHYITTMEFASFSDLLLFKLHFEG
jgi:hypothetical protein